MTTWGFANWENSQTTWDYRHNRDLEEPKPNTLHTSHDIQGMANRFQGKRKTETDSVTTRTPEIHYSIDRSSANKVVINPSRNGYITATIRRNNLPKTNNEKQLR